MRRIAIAEWILSLTLPQDRAASCVGDLTEEAFSRGWPRFWISVLRISCAHFFQGLSESPVSILRIAESVQIGAFLLWMLFLGFVMSSRFIPFGSPFKFEGTLGPPTNVRMVPSIELQLITGAMAGVFAFHAGYVGAFRSNRRELQVAFAINLFAFALHLRSLRDGLPQTGQLVAYFLRPDPTIFPPSLIFNGLLVTAGAILYRQRINNGGRLRKRPVGSLLGEKDRGSPINFIRF